MVHLPLADRPVIQTRHALLAEQALRVSPVTVPACQVMLVELVHAGTHFAGQTACY